MKGDRKLRFRRLLAPFAVLFLIVPPSCLAQEESQKIGGSPEQRPASETALDTEAQARFDALMKTVEETEQNTPTAIQIPTTGSAPAAGDLSGKVQTDEFADSDKPLFAMPGTATKAPLPNPVPTKPSIESVKVSYKNGRWKEALDTIAKLKPTDTTHYYAGLCYQGQGQLQAAVGEFQWVASYSKDPLLKYNASRALIAVGNYSRTRATYQGQGNNFARTATRGRSGGGGSVRRG